MPLVPQESQWYVVGGGSRQLRECGSLNSRKKHGSYINKIGGFLRR